MRSLAFAALMLAGSAITSVHANSMTRSVHYGDLDLSNPRDMATLNHRVAAAVENVCGSYYATTEQEYDQIKACRKRAMDGYHAQLAAARAAVPTNVATR